MDQIGWGVQCLVGNENKSQLGNWWIGLIIIIFKIKENKLKMNYWILKVQTKIKFCQFKGVLKHTFGKRLIKLSKK